MHTVLYDREFGYYTQGRARIGAEGDFTTAPHISALFGQAIARQIQQILLQGHSDILEIGAGSGKLAADILLELARLNCLPNTYQILEVSPQLRQLQRATLQRHAAPWLDRVQWIDSWPQNFCGFALANEVFDAMPIERFCRTHQTFKQVRVMADNGQLHESLSDTMPNNVRAQLDWLERAYGAHWPAHFTSEFNPNIEPWLQAFSENFKSGMLLIIDYGYPGDIYYRPERTTGTLRCHYRQHAHEDPYRYPGLQDITAHVDFSALATAADRAGLTVGGFAAQGQFLLNCHILDIAQDAIASATPAQIAAISQQLQCLTFPNQMGEQFCALGLTHNLADSLVPMGFSQNDRRHRL